MTSWLNQTREVQSAMQEVTNCQVQTNIPTLHSRFLVITISIYPPAYYTTEVEFKPCWPNNASSFHSASACLGKNITLKPPIQHFYTRLVISRIPDRAIARHSTHASVRRTRACISHTHLLHLIVIRLVSKKKKKRPTNTLGVIL